MNRTSESLLGTVASLGIVYLIWPSVLARDGLHLHRQYSENAVPPRRSCARSRGRAGRALHRADLSELVSVRGCDNRGARMASQSNLSWGREGAALEEYNRQLCRRRSRVAPCFR